MEDRQKNSGGIVEILKESKERANIFFGPLNLKRGEIFLYGIDIVEGLEYMARIAKDLILLLKAFKSFVFITYRLKHLKTF